MNKTAATILFLMGVVAFQSSCGTARKQDCDKRLKEEIHLGAPQEIVEATLKKCGFKTMMDATKKTLFGDKLVQGIPASARTQVLINLDSDNRVATVTVTTGLIGP
jgi:hypothetical protein